MEEADVLVVLMRGIDSDSFENLAGNSGVFERFLFTGTLLSLSGSSSLVDSEKQHQQFTNNNICVYVLDSCRISHRGSLASFPGLPQLQFCSPHCKRSRTERSRTGARGALGVRVGVSLSLIPKSLHIIHTASHDMRIGNETKV